MRKKIHMLFVFGFLLSFICHGNEEAPNTSNQLKELQTLQGKWSFKDEKLFQDEKGEGYYMALCKESVSDNISIEVVGSALSMNQYKYGCIGIVCKYIDDKNYMAVRFGAYGKISILVYEKGIKKIIELAPKEIKIGETYKCKATFSNGLIMAQINDQPLGVFKAPLAGKSGRPGLVAMSQAEFSSIKVFPEQVDTKTLQAKNKNYVNVIENNKIWQLEGVEYSMSPEELIDRESSPNYRSIAIYLRNKSASQASISKIFMDGIPGEKLIKTGKIAWWRSWPKIVKPGEMTQILIKISGVDQERAIQSFLGVPGSPYKFSFKSPETDSVFSIEFAIKPQTPPVRINFIAFDEKLKTLHAYVSANKQYAGKLIQKVEVNGVDVTDKSNLSEKIRLRTDSTPLRIDLKDELQLAAPTLITIRTENLLAGHATRAFPSRFPIQLTILGAYPEASDIKKIAKLNFTDMGFCGGGNKKANYLSEMKKDKLAFFPYGGSSPSKTIRSLKNYPVYPPLSGWWLDEVDKAGRKTPFEVQMELNNSDSMLIKENISLAPYCVNICEPSKDKGYMELADALSHEYGIDFGIRKILPQVDFITPGKIEKRELRIGRRPWWPYFRNIESVLLVDPKTKKTMDYYRPIDPREHRLIVYSCLANGAKGALNWNYGVNYFTPKQLTWLSKEYDAIRLNMTALKGKTAFGQTIPEEMLNALNAATTEAGRVNAELRLLGPLLAMGDLSDAASVKKCSPECNPKGGPAAFSRAVFCGADTIALLVINLNIDSDFKTRTAAPVRSYKEVEADIELSIPEWMKGGEFEIFEVSCNGITPVERSIEENKILFHIPRLKVSKAIIVTTNKDIRKSITKKWSELEKCPPKIKVECQSPWKLLGIVEELRAHGYKIPKRLEELKDETCFKLNIERYFKEGIYKKNLKEALKIMNNMDWLHDTPPEYKEEKINIVGNKDFPVWESKECLQDKTLSVGLKSYPCIMDFNNDGLKDLLVGDHDGFIYIYINYGSEQNPVYHEASRLKSTSTGKDIAVRFNPKLNFADMNGDGKPDIILGSYDGRPYMLQNESPNKTGFEYDDHKYTPFKTKNGIIDVGNYVYPFIADWNKDGLMDIIAGEIEGNVFLYQNIGTKKEPLFNEPVKIASISPDMYPDPFLVDLNCDGKRDLTLGSRNGKIYCFLNNGTDNAPIYKEAFLIKPAKKEIPAGRLSHIHFSDWNADGTIDLLLGNDHGEIRVFTGKIKDGKIEFGNETLLKTKKKVELISKPHPAIAIADWNGDGTLDIIAGGEGPELRIFPNRGTKRKAEFDSYALIPEVKMEAKAFANASAEEKNLWTNPGLEFITEYLGNAAPEVMDWDNDGKLDLLVGNYAGLIYFYKNIGTKQKAKLASPIALTADSQIINTGGYSTPRAVDWNKDGKLDLLSGNLYGKIIVYINSGTDKNPKLSEGKAIKVAGKELILGPRSIVEFSDLNGDSLNDLIIGNRLGKVYALKNTGTIKEPEFSNCEILQDKSKIWEKLYGGGWSGPRKDFPLKWKKDKKVSDMCLEATSCPRAIDFDNDGKKDLIISHRFGRIFIFKPAN